MTPKFISLILFCTLAGCSADSYQRDADLQVGKLLENRKQTTLGYTPKSEVSSEHIAPPEKKAYAKIPTSPIPPPTASPMEPARFELPYEKLGPSAQHGGAISEEEPAAPGFQTADLMRESLQRLRLGPAAAGPEAVVQLDLFKSIEYAVHHGRDYQTQSEQMYTATLDVLLQRHAFEPQPYATQQFQFVRGDRDALSRYNSALVATNTVGVHQRLPMGGEITAQALVNFTDALNDNTADGESSQVAITGTIPLLRGAGFSNLEPLIQSERNLVYQVRSFETYRRNYVVNIARQYFDLIVQQQSIVNRRIKYISSTNLTTQTRELYAAGRISFLEVQRALQTALQDENTLVFAEQQYENSLDDFKVLLGMPVEQNLDVQGVELDLALPDSQHTDLTALAVKYRLELQTDRDMIEDARRQIEVQKNGLLPDLNLTGATSINNQPNDAARDLDSRRWDASAGVTMNWPLDRVAERNSYRTAMINFEQAQRSYEQQRDQIISDARSSVRALQSAQISYDIQRRAIDLAQRRLDYSNELLTQGKVTARDVVESQEALLEAQDQFNSARANLQTQILILLRDSGTLRLDPAAGSIARAMDLGATPGLPQGN